MSSWIPVRLTPVNSPHMLSLWVEVFGHTLVEIRSHSLTHKLQNQQMQYRACKRITCRQVIVWKRGQRQRYIHWLCVSVCSKRSRAEWADWSQLFSRAAHPNNTSQETRQNSKKIYISVQFWCGFYPFSFLYDQLRPHRWWHLVKVSYCKTSPTHTEWCRLRPLQGKHWQHRISPNMWTAHLSELKCNTTWYPGPRGLD